MMDDAICHLHIYAASDKAHTLARILSRFDHFFRIITVMTI